MKKLLFLMFFPIISFGQYTLIPDATFEQRLINFGYDTIHDGQVLTANIINVDSLDLSSQLWGAGGNISDLTGIEGFTNLIYLDCSVNPLTSLDVSQNIHLNYLDCSGINFFGPTGQILNLNVSQNSSLSYLNCSMNIIRNLDLSQTTSLTYLDCSNNRITSLNFQSPFLETLECYNNKLTYLNVSQCIALKTLNCFTDSLYYGYTAKNNIMSLDLNQNIALEHLNCSYNNLSYLDVSQNIALEYLNCANNELYLLNANQNFNLTYLKCSNNHISYLDLSQDTSLITLICGEDVLTGFGPPWMASVISYGNNLKSLDISQNFNLTYLNCSNNELVNLDLKNGNNSNFTNFKCKNNPDLVCISVDDTLWADTNWTNLQSGNSISFNTNCPFVDIYTSIPDSMFEITLINLGHDSIQDGQVLTSNISNIDSLDLSSAGVSDLTGIEDFRQLSYLNCNMNELANFDISQNQLLENLQCRCSGLDNLDISQNSKLSILDCGNDIFSGTMPCQNSNNNNIISSLNLNHNLLLTSLGIAGNNFEILDITRNLILDDLRCQNNNLKVLDLRNGNNTNFTYFNALNNDSLYCIASDNSAWSSANWINIPSQSFFSNFCNYYTSVPDIVFEQNLINQGYDNFIDGQVLTNLIRNIDTLDLSGIFSGTIPLSPPIQDLTGIEDFISLIYLNCSEHFIDSLNLSQNTLLSYLDCSGIGGQGLSDLNVSQNLNLDYLNCNGNNLLNLDLTQNQNISYLSCADNQLTNVDLSQNLILSYLDCRNNQLDSLDLSLNLNLSHLDCRNNQLDTLDLSLNSNLTTLNCENNQISFLDVGLNSNLVTLDCSGNILNNLDLTQNPNLTDFFCDFNQLDTLDLTQNPNLSNLNCRNNLLSNLDIGHTQNLTNLNCRNNLLSNLDLSQTPSLSNLNCRNNLLSNLDIRNGNNTNLTNFSAMQNNLLSCISVDDSSWATANLTMIPNQTIFSNNCNILFTIIPDSAFEQRLIDYGYDAVQDGKVLTSNISSIDSLDISTPPNMFSPPKIFDLTGIESFSNLRFLNCAFNELTNLDLSQNTLLNNVMCGFNNIQNLNISQNINLEKLMCSHNPISNIDLTQNINLKTLNCGVMSINELDVSQNLNLDTIVCGYNQILNLNLSNNQSLIALFCGYNQLESLDIRNGNNINFTGLDATNNDSLFCISVDDSAWSSNNWTNIDSHTNFTNDCNPSTVDIIEIEKNLSVHPNPTSEEITISINNFNGNIQTEVYDLIGNSLQLTNKTTISLRDYARGIYILNVAYGDKVEEVKVIKE